MSTELIINGTAYQYPTSGEDPNWAEEAQEWASAVTDVLGTLLAEGDILQTTFSIANNIASPAEINGLVFDSGTNRSAFIKYSVYRTSDTNPSGNAEAGQMTLAFDDDASVDEKWQLIQGPVVGNAGIVFSVDDSGQLSYISSDIGAAGYSGVIKFSASTTAI